MAPNWPPTYPPLLYLHPPFALFEYEGHLGSQLDHKETTRFHSGGKFFTKFFVLLMSGFIFLRFSRCREICKNLRNILNNFT